MDSTRSGFRRATAASWMLAGLGVAGVAGASTLAYAATFKPPVPDAAVYADEAPAPEPPPVAIPNQPPLEAIGTPVDVPPPPPPPPPPVSTAVPTPEFIPRQAVQQVKTPTTQYVPPPTTAPPTVAAPRPTTQRRLTPAAVMPQKFSPRVTSRGS